MGTDWYPIMIAASTAEVHAILEKQPLGASMMEFELIALSPLMPLAIPLTDPRRS